MCVHETYYTQYFIPRNMLFFCPICCCCCSCCQWWWWLFGRQVEPYISYAKMINAKQKHGGKMLSKLSNISSNKFVLCEFLDRRLSLSMYYLTVACVRIARLQPFFISNGQWKGMDVTNFLLFPLFIFRFSSTWLNRTTTTTTKRGIEHVLSYYTYFIYVLLMSTHRNLPLSTPFRNRH